MKTCQGSPFWGEAEEHESKSLAEEKSEGVVVKSLGSGVKLQGSKSDLIPFCVL